MSHDRQGVAQVTRDDEEIASEWRESERPSQLNAAGRRRLALAWIWLAARASGWDGAKAQVSPGSGS